MAGESLSFDIVGHDRASGSFRSAAAAASDMGGKMDLAAKSAFLLQESLNKQRKATDASVGATLTLAKADKILADAERALSEDALAADFALHKETEAKKKSAEASAKAAIEAKAAAGRLNIFQKAAGAVTGAISGGAGGAGLLGSVGSLIGGTAGGFGLAGLVVVAAEVTSALSAAALGLGAFGAIAIPILSNLKTQLGTVSTANDAFSAAANNVNTAITRSTLDTKLYQASFAGLTAGQQNAVKLLGNQKVTWQNLTQSQRDNVVALSQNKTELKGLLPAQKTSLTALLASKAAWDELTPAQKKAAGSLGSVSAEWAKLTKALEPDVFKIFNQGLAIADKLLPLLLAPAKQAAGAISGLLTDFSNFLGPVQQSVKPVGDMGSKLNAMTAATAGSQGAGFRGFVAQMTKLSGPAITALGLGLGKIAIALGTFLQAAGRPQSVAALNRILGFTADAIGLVSWFINRGIGNWQKWIDIIHQSANKFDQARHGIAAGAAWLERTVAAIWTRMETDVLKLALNITGTFGRLPGPLGAPFRKAHAVIAGELAAIQFKAAQTARQINADWGTLHGKKVALTFGLNLPPGVSFPSRPIKGHGAAAGWRVPGSGGGDTVPAMLTPGEAVVPRHLVPAVAPFLSANRVPGFAAGGAVADFRGNFPSSGSIGAAAAAMQAAISTVGTLVKGILHINKSAFGFGGGLGRQSLRQIENWWIGAGGPGGGTAHVAAAITGAESGFRVGAVQQGQPYATTGWGLWQITPGNSEPQAGINGQLLNGPANARAAVAKFNQAGGSFSPWTTFVDGAYRQFMDHGGWLRTGWNPPIYNGTGHPEQVIPHGRSATAPVVLQVRAPHGATNLERALVEIIQKFVTVNGGDVQSALGRT